jgi:hypothetical protein
VDLDPRGIGPVNPSFPFLSGRTLLPFVFVLALGVAGGVYYAWVINPVEYTDTAPASLRVDFQGDYLALIAAAYAGTGDLDRARLRLSLIPEPDPAGRLAALAQQRMASGFPPNEAAALASLAAALGQRPEPAISPTSLVGASSASPRPAPTLTPTAPPAATRTPTATPGAPFQLLERESVCESDFPEPLVIVEVEDSAGRPVPGVEVLVIWDTGQDHFFTGLKTELSPGYGDFTMEPGVTYTVKLVDSVQSATGLAAAECTDSDGSVFLGSWRLRFAQPAATQTAP